MNGIEIGVNPMIGHFGPFMPTWYGLLVALAVAAGWWLGVREARRRGLDTEKMRSMILWGLLGGVIKKQNEGVRRLEGRAQQSLDEHRDAIQGYEDLAETLGTEPGTLGLAWLLSRPAVTAPIIGPRTADQFTTALKALDLELSTEHLDRLDELFPAPFPNGSKPAPEAYAW